MAKKKAPVGQDQETAARSAEPTRARRVPETILTFYELGERVLQRVKKDRSSDIAAAHAIADAENVSYDRARQAALFAKTFSRRDVTRLCDPGPDRSPLSADHILRVLKIANRRDRMRWLDHAAAKDWSARRLDREIQRAAGSAGGKGAPVANTGRPARGAGADPRAKRTLAETV
jgi:hypothetical protein